MSRAERIRQALTGALAAERVEVMDDSAKHAGHAGARPGGETHYTVLVVSGRFAGMNRVARHRMAMAALGAEFAGGLHALSLVLRTPDEAGGMVAAPGCPKEDRPAG